MSNPSRLWLGRSLIMIRSLVRGPSAALRLNRPAVGRTTKTHFEEDVRFVCDCDIAFAIWEFAAPSLFIAP